MGLYFVLWIDYSIIVHILIVLLTISLRDWCILIITWLVGTWGTVIDFGKEFAHRGPQVLKPLLKQP